MVLVKGSDRNLTTLLELKSKFSYTPIAEQNFNCFYIVKICEAWNGFNINSNKFMFFFRVPKCVKSVILWMWIWPKDCQGEQSSLSFMKKTSQTDEESFSNYGSGSKYLEKGIVPLHSWVCDGICEIDQWVLLCHLVYIEFTSTVSLSFSSSSSWQILLLLCLSSNFAPLTERNFTTMGGALVPDLEESWVHRRKFKKC